MPESPRIGGLFFGYGGLDMAVSSVVGGSLAWVSEIDKGACRVIAHRFPGVPNLGDVTAVDWSSVEPVDVLCGGSPCQDLSTAGKRAGMTEGTRSNLWVAMREAIAVLRPSLVVWENVNGAFTAAAASALEPCPGCVGDGSDFVALRALGRVLGDLSSLGYDAFWTRLRAADVGAPHGRARIFIAAHPHGEGLQGLGWEGAEGGCVAAAGDLGSLSLLPTPAVADGESGHATRSGARSAELLLPGVARAQAEGSLLPTPNGPTSARTPEQHAAGIHQVNLADLPHLLPTPAVNDMGDNKTVEWWDEFCARTEAKHHNSNGHGDSRSIAMKRLLPTVKASSNENRQSERYPESGNFEAIIRGDRWGKYAPAIARWESLLRAAPEPTTPSPKTGEPQLSARFAEWMMGLPDGWVTDVPGLSRAAMLKLCGNGVVPQQAAAALRINLANAARYVCVDGHTVWTHVDQIRADNAAGLTDDDETGDYAPTFRPAAMRFYRPGEGRES